MGEAPALWAGPEPRRSQDGWAWLRVSVLGRGEVLSSGLNPCKVGGAWSGLPFGGGSSVQLGFW